MHRTTQDYRDFIFLLYFFFFSFFFSFFKHYFIFLCTLVLFFFHFTLPLQHIVSSLRPRRAYELHKKWPLRDFDILHCFCMIIYFAFLSARFMIYYIYTYIWIYRYIYRYISLFFSFSVLFLHFIILDNAVCSFVAWGLCHMLAPHKNFACLRCCANIHCFSVRLPSNPRMSLACKYTCICMCVCMNVCCTHAKEQTYKCQAK